MKNWKRIILVVFVFVGSATFFGYWSVSQFNETLDSLDASYVASTNSVYEYLRQASTSSEISEELATSTDNAGLASTSPEISGEFATSTDAELSFTFPQEGDGVYMECVYKVSWQSLPTINSLEIVLVDAGTRETAGPIASGLAKENTIDKDLQNLEWKVGNVWPGSYYIKVSKINGIDTEFRSDVFEINKIPENISASEKENICKESVEPSII